MVLADRRRPIATLRQPDALWHAPKVAECGRDAGLDLGVDRRVAVKQRQVAVRGGTGEDLEVACLDQLAKCADKIMLIMDPIALKNVRVEVAIEEAQPCAPWI